MDILRARSLLPLAMVSIGLFSQPVEAIPYAGGDVSKCFPEKGKVDMPCADDALKAIEAVAKSWPPTTDSETDKQRAGNNVLTIHQGLYDARKSVAATREFFLKLAWSANMGHNLDVPGMGSRADQLYKGFLGQYPKDAEGNFRYGAFLSGVNGRQKDAVTFLETARSLGDKRANYTLGATYALLHEDELAKKHLKEYLVDFPDNVQAKGLLAGIEQGKTMAVSAPGAN